MSNNVYRDIARAMTALYGAPGFTYFTDTSTTSSCSAYTTTDPAGAACPVGNRSNVTNGPAVALSRYVSGGAPLDAQIAAARAASAQQLLDTLIAAGAPSWVKDI